MAVVTGAMGCSLGQVGKCGVGKAKKRQAKRRETKVGLALKQAREIKGLEWEMPKEWRALA